MTAAFIAPTDIIIAAMFPPKFDRHVQDWKWHAHMVNVNPGYQAEIAQRQADKRSAGIGPEGRCPR